MTMKITLKAIDGTFWCEQPQPYVACEGVGHHTFFLVFLSVAWMCSRLSRTTESLTLFPSRVESVFVALQLLIQGQLFMIPWAAARQASLSFTVFRSLLKLMSLELIYHSMNLSWLIAPRPVLCGIGDPAPLPGPNAKRAGRSHRHLLKTLVAVWPPRSLHVVGSPRYGVAGMAFLDWGSWRGEP